MEFAEIVDHLIHIHTFKRNHLTPPEFEALHEALNRLTPLLTQREAQLLNIPWSLTFDISF